MECLWLHGDTTSPGILFSLLAFNLFLQVLKVGKVTGVANQGSIIDNHNTFDIWETGQATVRSHGVGSKDDSILVLDGEDGGSGGDWILRVGCWSVCCRRGFGREVVVSGWARATGPEWWNTGAGKW